MRLLNAFGDAFSLPIEEAVWWIVLGVPALREAFHRALHTHIPKSYHACAVLEPLIYVCKSNGMTSCPTKKTQNLNE